MRFRFPPSPKVSAKRIPLFHKEKQFFLKVSETSLTDANIRSELHKFGKILIQKSNAFSVFLFLSTAFTYVLLSSQSIAIVLKRRIWTAGTTKTRVGYNLTITTPISTIDRTTTTALTNIFLITITTITPTTTTVSRITDIFHEDTREQFRIQYLSTTQGKTLSITLKFWANYFPQNCYFPFTLASYPPIYPNQGWPLRPSGILPPTTSAPTSRGWKRNMGPTPTADTGPNSAADGKSYETFV